MVCHGLAKWIVGPDYKEIAAKYRNWADVETKLIEKVRNGGQGGWGAVPMPPQGHAKDDEIRQLVQWILEGAQAQ